MNANEKIEKTWTKIVHDDRGYYEFVVIWTNFRRALHKTLVFGKDGNLVHETGFSVRQFSSRDPNKIAQSLISLGYIDVDDY